MKIYYVGPHDAVEIVATENITCVRGEAVEVDDELAKSLLQQDVWSDTKPKASRTGKQASE